MTFRPFLEELEARLVPAVHHVHHYHPPHRDPHWFKHHQVRIGQAVPAPPAPVVPCPRETDPATGAPLSWPGPTEGVYLGLAPPEVAQAAAQAVAAFDALPVGLKLYVSQDPKAPIRFEDGSSWMPAGQLGVTNFSFGPDDRFTLAIVDINLAYDVANHYDLGTVCSHELGHALGLDHDLQPPQVVIVRKTIINWVPVLVSDLMASYLNPYEVRTFSPADTAAMQQDYGAG